MMGLPSEIAKQSGAQSVPQLQRSVAIPSSQIKNQKFADSLENQSDSSQPGSPPDSIYDAETRIITMTTKKSTNLGISLMGGNAVGIYVHDVQGSSLADNAGMRKGDQVMKQKLLHVSEIWIQISFL